MNPLFGADLTVRTNPTGKAIDQSHMAVWAIGQKLMQVGEVLMTHSVRPQPIAALPFGAVTVMQ